MAKRTSSKTPPELEKNSISPEIDATESTNSKTVEKTVEKSVEAVSIIKNGNIFIREFSLRDHGEDFQSLAKEFASKFKDQSAVSIVPSDTVIQLELRYRELDGFNPDISFHTLTPHARDQILKDVKTDNVPMVDKFKRFTNKDEALEWNVYKKGTLVAIFAKKARF